MRKILMLLLAIFTTAVSTLAAELPDDIKKYVSKDFPNATFRFDGVILLPDGTEYLPLLPSKILTPDNIKIDKTYPENKKLSEKPNVVIFNNDYVLLKVLTDKNGNKTIYKIGNPPDEIRTGLFPQDMLVPQGLVIPQTMKGIVGNLVIPTAKESGIKVEMPKVTVSPTNLKTLATIEALKNKTFYITSSYSRNILAINQDGKTPEYALAQKNVPISMKGYDNNFLLVTSYDKKSMDIISLADDDIIKQIFFKTQPDEIVIDYKKSLAYVSSSEDSSIYVINLKTMTLLRQLKISGLCEKLTLSDDGEKIFYFDKNSREIIAIELNNKYLLKNLGKFPNVSKIAYDNNKVYITSRTKNRLAIVDYDTIGLIGETEVCEKPVDMLNYNGKLFILGANENVIQVLDTKTDTIGEKISLNTNGFSTKIHRLEGTNLALITDTKSAIFSVLDLDSQKIIKTVQVNLPISSIVVTNKIKKINK
ncbi:hypothetical protein J6E39_07920 [bacterium]|nr:hypothetical protein [bacterium]